MKFFSYHILFIVLTAMGILSTNNIGTQGSTSESRTPEAGVPIADNPLLANWSGPYGGVPPFDKVKVEFFEPALEAAMDQRLEQTEKIASSSAPPTFENTIAALEKSGQTMDRVQRIYSIWSGNMSSPDFQAVQRKMAPKLAALSDKIIQNEKLFKRIEAVYNSPEKAKLTGEQQRLVWVYYTDFTRSGARLDNRQKGRLSDINQELAGLFTKFSQNVLADENEKMLVLEHENDLAGLPLSVKNAAAEQAQAAQDTLSPYTWTADAQARLDRAPEGFMRECTKALIEKHADKLGATVITLEVATEGIEQAKGYMADAMKTGNLKDMIANLTGSSSKTGASR